MANYFTQGASDAKARQFYAYSLPPGTDSQSETRVTYRAGWVTQRALQGQKNLPACIAERFGHGRRYYWIVSIDANARPVYNVTDGSLPSNESGYYDLAALMRLKGDSLN